jgi:2-oxoisovalerate dehydrogenase E1 component
MALAFQREGSGRVALSFIGDGGTSLGEWHEAINLCAARRLPAVFCVENNQTALSTPVHEQSAVRAFADKASGYGVPGITWTAPTRRDRRRVHVGADRARDGDGPTLIELVSMRMCGHAHHDDMLYLGRRPPPGWEYPDVKRATGYVDAELYDYLGSKDPIATYAQRLEAEGIIRRGISTSTVRRPNDSSNARPARDCAPWPAPESAGAGLDDEAPRARVEVLDPAIRLAVDTTQVDTTQPLPDVEPGTPVDRHGSTFLDAIALGIGDALRADRRVFVYGEDVGGGYGNAFLLLRPLLSEFRDRIINSPLAESGVLGVCVGAALAGQRPIGELQFNDFVANGSTSW